MNPQKNSIGNDSQNIAPNNQVRANVPVRPAMQPRANFRILQQEPQVQKVPTSIRAQGQQQITPQMRAQIVTQIGSQNAKSMDAQVRAQLVPQIRLQSGQPGGQAGQFGNQFVPQVRLQSGLQVRPQLATQVRPQVGPQIQTQLRQQIRPQGVAQIAAQVAPQVTPQIRPQLRLQSGLQVRPQVGAQVAPQVAPHVRPQMRPQIGPNTGVQVRPQVGPQIRAQQMVVQNRPSTQFQVVSQPRPRAQVHQIQQVQHRPQLQMHPTNPLQINVPRRPVVNQTYVSISEGKPVNPVCRPQFRHISVNGKSIVTVPRPMNMGGTLNIQRPIMAPVNSATIQKPSMVKVETTTQGGRRIVHLAGSRTLPPKTTSYSNSQEMVKMNYPKSGTTSQTGGTEIKIHHSRDIMNKAPTATKIIRPAVATPKPAISYPPANVIRKPFPPSYDARKPESFIANVDLSEEKKLATNLNKDTTADSQILNEPSFLNIPIVRERYRNICIQDGLLEPPPEVFEIVSIAVEEHLKSLIEKVCLVSEHRRDNLRMDSKYKQVSNPRAQLEFYKDIEEGREKSVMDFEDVNEVKARLEEAHKHKMEKQFRLDTEVTAMQAILGRKKSKLEELQSKAASEEGGERPAPTFLPSTFKRRKYITKTDMHFALEQDKVYRNFLHKRFMSF